MAITTAESSGTSHPWLEKFAEAPEVEFGELLAGHAEIFPYDRADAPDAVKMLFGSFHAEHPMREALDRAALAWLDQQHRSRLPETRPRLQRFIREVCEALEIVALMRLPGAATDLRRKYPRWHGWTSRLVLSSSRDARAEYLRTLALTQSLVSATAEDGAIGGLEPLWLNITRDSGGRLPDRYLDIGLLGLRRLPKNEAGSDVPWLAGIGQWALAQDPPSDRFKSVWFGLKALYPRAPRRWRDLVGGLLSSDAFRGRDIQPPAWWGVDPDLARMQGGRSRSDADPTYSPSREEARYIISQFGRPFHEIEPQIDTLMHKHHVAATATGDPAYFVRAAHFLGDELLKPRGNDHHPRSAKAQKLAQLGLAWRPFDSHLWALWRDALDHNGDLEAAELIGWETVRRAPHEPTHYLKLANIIARDRERRGEAERLLRQICVDFPRNLHARTQLAEFLITEDRFADAVDVVDQSINAGVLDEVTFVLQARLRFHAGDPAGAKTSLEESLRLNSTNETTLNYLDRLDRGEPLPVKSSLFARSNRTEQSSAAAIESGVLEEAKQNGVLRRLRFRLESDDAENIDNGALAELRRVFDEGPTFAYAELLAVRHGIWNVENQFLPTFAAAFEQALREEDQVKLEELAVIQPRLMALIQVAQALLGDEAAARRVESWLADKPAAEEEAAVNVLRAKLTTLRVVGNHEILISDVVRDSWLGVKSALHDAIEICAADMALAA